MFSGDNGAGKTNLLEAISLLTPGRGLRRAPYADVAREGGDGGFALHARLDGPEGQVEIGTGIAGGEAAGEGGRTGAHQWRAGAIGRRPCWNGCASSG